MKSNVRQGSYNLHVKKKILRKRRLRARKRARFIIFVAILSIVAATSVDKITNYFSKKPTEQQLYKYVNDENVMLNATQAGDLTLIRSLVLQGNDINIRDFIGQTPLMLAAKSGNIKLIQFLLENGANVNTKSDFGKTAVMFAAQYGDLKMMKLLVQKGANILEKDNADITVLMYAAMNSKYPDIFNFILESNQNISAISKTGQTALLLASANLNVKAVKSLIERGAKIDIQEQISGINPLIAAAGSGKFDTVKLLVKNGIDINKTDKAGNTALIYAASKGHRNIVKFLVKKGANINHTNNEGNSALLLAAANNQLKMVEFCIKSDVDINTANKAGKTALMAAVENANPEMIKYLLDKDADIDAVDMMKETPLMYAARKRTYITTSNSDNRKVFIQGDNNKTNIIELLINNNADIDNKNKTADTALILAADSGNTEAVNTLINNGVNIDAQNNDGATALIKSILSSDNAIAKILINNGANPDITDKKGKTAINYARERSNSYILTLLPKD